MDLTVLQPGLLSTVQDAGRIGHAASGIGHAGAMDPVALRLANALAGNPANAAALEICLQGPQLHFAGDARIALAGAPIRAWIDAEPVPTWQSLSVRAGAQLRLGRCATGMYSYLAIRGGINLAPVLGSRSTDLHAGIGPLQGRALRAGDSLPIAPYALLDRPAANTTWSLDPRDWFDPHDDAALRILPGRHFPHLTDASRAALLGGTFQVAADSNRVGLRLDGPVLLLNEKCELCSSAVTSGTLQLPPGGQPIALMAEAPTTGGYPRIAHVIGVDLPRLAQRRRGDTVRFTMTSLEVAHAALARREQALQRLECDIRSRLAERNELD